MKPIKTALCHVSHFSQLSMYDLSFSLSLASLRCTSTEMAFLRYILAFIKLSLAFMSLQEIPSSTRVGCLWVLLVGINMPRSQVNGYLDQLAQFEHL